MGKYGRQREQTPLAPFQARNAPFPADADIYRALSLTNRYEAAGPQSLREPVMRPVDGAPTICGAQNARLATIRAARYILPFMRRKNAV
jgi:hypothetical protein